MVSNAVVAFSLFASLKVFSAVNYKVGILYENKVRANPKALQLAVQYVNSKILSKDRQLSLVSMEVTQTDPLDALKKSCILMSSGIIAQVGPGMSKMVNAVKALNPVFQIPLITPTASSVFLEKAPFVVHMVPSDRHQGMAVSDIIQYFNWTKINIITSSDSYGTAGILSVIEKASNLNWQIVTLQQIRSHTTDHFTSVLTNAKKGGSRIMVVNCGEQESIKLFEVATQLKMTVLGWVWIVTDATTDSGRFLTASHVPDHLLGLLGTSFDEEEGGLVDDFVRFYRNSTACPNCSIPMGVGKWIDSIILTGYALRNFHGNLAPPLVSTCKRPHKWSQGNDFFTALGKVRDPGVSADFNFLNNLPVVFKYVIKNSRPTGWRKVGSWVPGDGLSRNFSEVIYFSGHAIAAKDYINTLNGKHLTIVTRRSDPLFTFIHGPPKTPQSNIRLGDMKGYGIDFLTTLADMLNFTYKLYEPSDSNFGTKDPETGLWNGMMKELTFKPFMDFTDNLGNLHSSNIIVDYLTSGDKLLATTLGIEVQKHFLKYMLKS